MYFEMLPQLMINLSGEPNQYKLVTDITTRLVSSLEVRNNVFLYEYYDVLDGETPDIVADKFYDNSHYHWIIMLCNDIIDPVYDWVMTPEALMAHVIDTYGEENIYHTHHYEDENGNWVGFDFPNAAKITNIQFESQENEKKRSIRILQPRYLNAFIAEFQQKVKQKVE